MFSAFLCSSFSCEPNTQVDRNPVKNALFPMCIPILFWCFSSYPCVFRIMQAKWALIELLELQVGVEENFCVVCPAPITTSSTSSEPLHRQKHPPNQTSWLMSVFRRLRSPSLPPAPTATASPSRLSRWTWGVHGSTREVALFCFCLCYALLNITCYIIVMFTS